MQASMIGGDKQLNAMDTLKKDNAAKEKEEDKLKKTNAQTMMGGEKKETS